MSSTATPAKNSLSLKGQEIQKKSIFKPLLTNPYTNKNIWPRISPEIQSDLLNALEANILPIIKQWNSFSKEEKEKFPDLKNDYNNVLTGFNSIMKELENQIQLNLKTNLKNNQSTDSNEITMLFVCKSDISCDLLFRHIPTLCQLANVKLITLPKGSSKRLSKALGIERKVQFLALKRKISEKDKFLTSTVDSTVDNIKIGFLENYQRQSLNMNVKFVLTQMPIKNNNKKKN